MKLSLVTTNLPNDPCSIVFEAETMDDAKLIETLSSRFNLPTVYQATFQTQTHSAGKILTIEIKP